MNNDQADHVKVIIAEALTKTLEGVWDADNDPALVEELAEEIAVQKLMAAAAATPEKKALHERNVEHLLATVQSEAVSRYIAAYGQGVDAFAAALKAVIGLIVKAALT